MSDDLVRSAIAEEARLHNELRALPIYRKLETVRAVIAAYKGNGFSDAKPASAEQPASTTSSERKAPRSGSKRAEVISAVKEFFRTTGKSRAETPEILTALQSAGISIGGVNAKAALASILSHAPEFDNVRRLGYGLRNPETG